MTEFHRRRSIRLKDYDYSQSGAYFVTIVAYQKEALFGEISDGIVLLNRYGTVVKSCWEIIPEHFPHVQPDVSIVMPNHFHGVIRLADYEVPHIVGAQHAAPLHKHRPQPVSGSLPAIIRSFKSAVTRGINLLRDFPGTPVWQRNYYEHVVRSEGELNEIRAYILCNASKWALDPENAREREFRS